MGHELHDLNVIRRTEGEEDVQDSTALLEAPEGEVPTTNDDTVSGAGRRNFDHPPENDMYVHLMSFRIVISTNALREHDLHDLNMIYGTEDEGDVQDSTSLLDPPEGEAPSRNSDIVSGTHNASRRSFDHCSEADMYVHIMSFRVD